MNIGQEQIDLKRSAVHAGDLDTDVVVVSLDSAQIAIAQAERRGIERALGVVDKVGNETYEEIMAVCESHPSFTEGCGWCQERSERLTRSIEKKHYLAAIKAIIPTDPAV